MLPNPGKSAAALVAVLAPASPGQSGGRSVSYLAPAGYGTCTGAPVQVMICLYDYARHQAGLRRFARLFV
jgi:hypothetical protein